MVATGRAHVLFAFAPTLDTHDRFFNCYPSSLLHAIAPAVADMDTGRLEASYCGRIYHPKVFTREAVTLWRSMLAHEEPTHVAISSTYDSWHVALTLSQMVRELLPEAVVIHGGPHLDEVLEPFVLKRTPSLDPLAGGVDRLADLLVGGDGEHALTWLLEATSGCSGPFSARAAVATRSEEIAALPGTGHVAFRHQGERWSVRFRNRLELDELPFVPRHLLPAKDLYDFDCFIDDHGQRMPTVTMITHRGCRARCNFCSEGLPYQGRSHEHILAEAAELRASGVRAVFLDDSTVQDDPHLESLLAGFRDLGLTVGAADPIRPDPGPRSIAAPAPTGTDLFLRLH